MSTFRTVMALCAVMVAYNDLSKWRSPRRPRGATRAIGRLRKHPELNMFYGYPADLIAEWCCAAPSTEFAYKSGRLKSPGSKFGPLLCWE